MAWIAKSNAEQRAGRAGRCRNGYCFRLYSRREYESMLDTQVPEMRRAAIHASFYLGALPEISFFCFNVALMF